MLVSNRQVSPLFDFSVNQSKTYINPDNYLILQAEKKNTGQVAGNFFGGGTGNKPICGIKGYENIPISLLPIILADIELWSRPTGTDADETQHGLAFNVLIDLLGTGVSANYKVISITNTLNSYVDIYSRTGISASVTSFNINDFQVISGYSSGEKTPFFRNYFYIVGGLTNYVANTNFRTNAIIDNTWPGIPMNLDILLNGGTMPLTGAQFTGGYPNCKIIGVTAFDGGHPANLKLTGLMAQIGDSSLALRTVTAVKSLTVGGSNVLVRQNEK